MNERECNQLSIMAVQVRQLILDAIYKVGTGHIGPSYSMVEILIYLYHRKMRHRPEDPYWVGRDYFVLSKGHGCPGLYAVLALSGYFPQSDLFSLRQLGSHLQGHPDGNKTPGVEVSTGSLGQGLSNSVGIAVGLRKMNRSNHVYCMTGDGELQEGLVWESLMAASFYGLSNLTVIVDENGLQGDGKTKDVMDLGDLCEKFAAFGCNPVCIDGHSFSEIEAAFVTGETKDKPKVVIAKTVKGKGVSFMEDSIEWHHRPLTEEEYIAAASELKIDS